MKKLQIVFASINLVNELKEISIFYLELNQIRDALKNSMRLSMKLLWLNYIIAYKFLLQLLKVIDYTHCAYYDLYP